MKEETKEKIGAGVGGVAGTMVVSENEKVAGVVGAPNIDLPIGVKVLLKVLGGIVIIEGGVHKLIKWFKS